MTQHRILLRIPPCGSHLTGQRVKAPTETIAFFVAQDCMVQQTRLSAAGAAWVAPLDLLEVPMGTGHAGLFNCVFHF